MEGTEQSGHPSHRNLEPPDPSYFGVGGISFVLRIGVDRIAIEFSFVLPSKSPLQAPLIRSFYRT